MKGKVGILLFAALIYLMDLVLLPSVMQTGPAANTCQAANACRAASSCQAAAVKAPGCCHHGKTAAQGRNPSPVCGKMATGKSGSPTDKSGFPLGKSGSTAGKSSEPCGRWEPCGRSGEPCGKNNPRDCNNSANCINCPLCFSATMAVPYHAGALPLLCKRAYPTLPATPVTDYYGRCWKPPDAGQFS
jgi:hypothetical protein